MIAHGAYTLCLSLLFLAIAIRGVVGQVGPSITNPPYNGTIKGGDTVKIEYSYENMGTGNYTVDIALWNDASATQLIQNVTTGQKLEGGNSTGSQLNFTEAATYEWHVPGDLTIKEQVNGSEQDVQVDIFYLTVTTNIDTAFFTDLSLRSRPIMLHFNAGVLNLPSHTLLFLLLSVITYCLL